MATGPHGDGRFGSAGELTRHIFSAELRYAERLLGQPVTDASGVPADDVEALVAFGRRSRAAMRQLLAAMPAADLDVEREFTVIAYVLRMTPRKVILHVVTHEIRHWAQVATLLRMHGFASGFHDFLMSPVYGGTWEKAARGEVRSEKCEVKSATFFGGAQFAIRDPDGYALFFIGSTRT